jgi:hypothetical protein
MPFLFIPSQSEGREIKSQRALTNQSEAKPNPNQIAPNLILPPKIRKKISTRVFIVIHYQ